MPKFYWKKSTSSIISEVIKLQTDKLWDAKINKALYLEFVFVYHNCLSGVVKRKGIFTGKQVFAVWYKAAAAVHWYSAGSLWVLPLFHRVQSQLN